MEESFIDYNKVSVIVPVYNDLEGIKKCLNSLFNQSIDRELFEIIVIDNGSTDGTKEFLKQSPVNFLEMDEIQSSYAARNKGIQHAKNEILGFTDSDVIVDRNWIRNGLKSYNKLRKNGMDGVIFGKIHFTGNPFQNIYTLYDYTTGFQNLLATNNIFTSKSVFSKVGFFNQKIISGGDNEWGERIIKNGLVIKKSDDTMIYHPLRNNFKSHFRKRLRTGYGKGQTGYRHYGETVTRDENKLQTIQDYGDLGSFLSKLKTMFFRFNIQIRLIVAAFYLIRNNQQKSIKISKFIITYIPLVLFFSVLTIYGTLLQKTGKKFNR